jgi:hypothetical protein
MFIMGIRFFPISVIEYSECEGSSGEIFFFIVFPILLITD